MSNLRRKQRIYLWCQSISGLLMVLFLLVGSLFVLNGSVISVYSYLVAAFFLGVFMFCSNKAVSNLRWRIKQQEEDS